MLHCSEKTFYSMYKNLVSALAEAPFLAPMTLAAGIVCVVSARAGMPRAALDTNSALLAIAAGVACLCVEFCRPGLVVAGAAGAALTAVGVHALPAGRGPAEFRSEAALAVAAAAALCLLRIAWRARRNKACVRTDIS